MRKIIGNILGRLTVIVSTVVLLLVATAVLPFAVLADFLLSYPDIDIREVIDYIWEELYLKIYENTIEALKEL